MLYYGSGRVGGHTLNLKMWLEHEGIKRGKNLMEWFWSNKENGFQTDHKNQNVKKKADWMEHTSL